jgi:hypothetical protein
MGVIAPSLVSLVLAYLYLQFRNITADQRDIAKNQQQIQQQQKQIIELDQLPQPIIDSWRVDDDKLIFEISNVGDGAAYNLSYVLEVLPFKVQNTPIQTDLNPAFGFDQVIPFARNNEDVSKHKNTLESGETGQFIETVCVAFEGGEQYRPFSEASKDVEYPSPECFVDIRLWLTYNDAVNDERQSQPVIDIILKRDQVEGNTFEETMVAEPVGDTRYEDASRMVLPENVDESRLERFRRHGRTTTHLD